MGKPKPSTDNWMDMPLAEFRARVERVKQAAARFQAEVAAELPGLVTLSQEARAHAQRLRDGEDEMLLSVLDLIDHKPALFESLADEDEGHDPGRYETELQRDRIAKYQHLRDVSQALDPLAQLLDDSLLHLADLFRPSIRAAIQIAKPIARRDAVIQTHLARALDFLSAPARKAAATRAERRDAATK